MNGFGKVRRCTERCGTVVDFYLWLAATMVTVRLLIQQARETFRWPTRRRPAAFHGPMAGRS